MNVLRIVLAVLLLAVVGPVAAKGMPLETQKYFYLTTGTYAPDEVDSACASGYHFASYWELMDIASMIYDEELGPPVFPGPETPPFGWMDTYGVEPNCGGWTTTSCSPNPPYPCGSETDDHCCPTQEFPDPPNVNECCGVDSGMVGELRFFPPPEGQPWKGGWDIHPHPCFDIARPRVWCASD